MALRWIRESPARWDGPKRRIVGAEGDVFAASKTPEGELVPGDWWRVEDGGRTVGYGWMDTTWGDAEILLAVDRDARGRGVGTFILDRLETEAATQGLNYLYNVVPAGHPDPKGLAAWLRANRFADDGEGQLKRRVLKG